MSRKKCTCCKIEKELNEFWFNKKQNIYHPNCKTCKYEKSKKYINFSKHKEQLKISKKEEYERNNSKYITRVLKNQRTLEGRLKHNIRTRISRAISRRSNSSKTLLGCEIEFYISYLEYLFNDSMSWDNYGTYWHIDHINPICNFNLTIDEQKLLAFNWKNTRPLKADENLSRSNKPNFNEIQIHNNLIEKFLNATSSNCGELLRA